MGDGDHAYVRFGIAYRSFRTREESKVGNQKEAKRLLPSMIHSQPSVHLILFVDIPVYAKQQENTKVRSSIDRRTKATTRSSRGI